MLLEDLFLGILCTLSSIFIVIGFIRCIKHNCFDIFINKTNMKKTKDYYNCPFCQAERDGVSRAWGMSDIGWGQLKEKHDKEHIEHEKN